MMTALEQIENQLKHIKYGKIEIIIKGNNITDICASKTFRYYEKVEEVNEEIAETGNDNAV